MRIISGKFKGKRLIPLTNNRIRPTSARAKEMIFNTLHSILKKKEINIENLHILDCFCGSGALGLECLSRGCKKVYFLDKSSESINITKKNCVAINVEKFSVFFKSDFRDINLPSIEADIFFLDPPYNHFVTSDVLKTLENLKLIKKGSIGIVELPKIKEIKTFQGYSILKEKKISTSLFYFIQKD